MKMVPAGPVKTCKVNECEDYRRQPVCPLTCFSLWTETMKQNKPHIAFWGAALLLLVLNSCKKPVSPQYIGYENFQMENLGLKNTVLATRVKLYNPNGFPLQVKSASVDVYINNDFLGHSSLDSLIILPARDTSYVPLRLTASAKDIVSNTLKAWLNPDVNVKIKGTARAGRNGFFITIPIDYEGVQRIEF